jgi:PPOX class probable F420-dependent enzyme
LTAGIVSRQPERAISPRRRTEEGQWQVISDELWRIVSNGRNGILATTNADGSPQLSNIYYLSNSKEREVRFSTTTVRRKGRNLLRDPRAALHVSGENFLNFAVASGTVSLAIPRNPDDPAVDELFEIHEALGAAPLRAGFGEKMIAANRMAVRLTVKRLYGQLLDRRPRETGRRTGE